MKCSTSMGPWRIPGCDATAPEWRREQLDLSQSCVEEAAESAANHVGFFLYREGAESQWLGDHDEDAHGGASRYAFSRNGREHVARKIDFLQCQERSAIGVINELPRLVGDPPDVRGEDQVQSLADLF